MSSDAATPGRTFAGLRLPCRARPAKTADVASVPNERNASNRIAADRETLRRHHLTEQQRAAREREFERRWWLR